MARRKHLTEVVPHAFELVLQYVSTLNRGGFSRLLEHDHVGGIHLAVAPVVGMRASARAALDDVAEGRFTVLASHGWTGPLATTGGASERSRASSRRGAQDQPPAFAVVDVVLAGAAWCIAARFPWRADDLTACADARAHERVVLMVDDSWSARSVGYRVEGDDVESRAVREVIRSMVLREAILRPAFAGTDQPSNR